MPTLFRGPVVDDLLLRVPLVERRSDQAGLVDYQRGGTAPTHCILLRSFGWCRY